MALNTKLRLACILQDMGSYREFWAEKGKVWSTLLVRFGRQEAWLRSWSPQEAREDVSPHLWAPRGVLGWGPGVTFEVFRGAFPSV